jgi:hypothetical protein
MSSQIVARYLLPTADVPFPWVHELRLALANSFSQQRLTTTNPEQLPDKLSRSPTNFTDSVTDWLLAGSHLTPTSYSCGSVIVCSLRFSKYKAITRISLNDIDQFVFVVVTHYILGTEFSSIIRSNFRPRFR